MLYSHTRYRPYIELRPVKLARSVVDLVFRVLEYISQYQRSMPSLVEVGTGLKG